MFLRHVVLLEVNWNGRNDGVTDSCTAFKTRQPTCLSSFVAE